MLCSQASEGQGLVLMLPFPSVTTWALIELSLLWGARTRRHGGFAGHDHRASSSDLTGALLAAACMKAGNGTINIALVGEFTIKWPRPSSCGPSLGLSVSGSGRVALQQFFIEAQHLQGHRQAWWLSSALSQLCDGLGEAPSLQSLMAATSAIDSLRPFHLQLLWWCGSQLQQLLLSSSRGQHVAGGPKLKIKCMADCLGDKTEMDRWLALYVRNGKRLASSATNVSLCTDKAAVCGLGSGLQSSIFVLGGSNQAIMGIPQVEQIMNTLPLACRLVSPPPPPTHDPKPCSWITRIPVLG